MGKVSLSGDGSTGVTPFRPTRKISATSKRIKKPLPINRPYAKRIPCGCNININCGPGYRYRPFMRNQRRPVLKPPTQSDFDKLSADELIYLVENSPNPELMGAALRKFFKRARTKAKAFAKKVKTRFRKMPTWAKLAVPGVGIAVGAKAIGKAVKKRRSVRLTKKKQAAQRRKVAALARPANRAAIAQRQAAPRPVRTIRPAAAIAVPSAVKQQIEEGARTAVAAPETPAAATEQKKGLGALLPLGLIAAALPFIL